MTQLFIAGMEAVLPENFQCKSVSENPLFTKASDYTLDITLSLENPINARIYKHINRINSLSRFESREAMLVSDNEVVIKGIEILLSYTNKEVSIQIAAGNSNLNYLIGDDLELRSLNLGEAVINKSTIVSNLKLDYPAVDFQLLPFYDPDNDFVGNRYTYGMNKNFSDWVLRYAYDGTAVQKLTYSDSSEQFHEYMPEDANYIREVVLYENYRPQPYLWAVVKKVFTALGYSLSNDIEEHQIYKYAYIVHANDTLEFAKMLPNWTVKKFIEELENLFDCTLIVDNNEMQAKIVFNYNFYNTANQLNFIMLDEFDVDIESDDQKTEVEKSVKYNLPSTDYYKYQNMSDELIKELTVNNHGSKPDSQAIDNIAATASNKSVTAVKASPKTLYKSKDLLFIDYVDNNSVIAKAVNDYRPYNSNNENRNEISIDIIPAEFFISKWAPSYFSQTGALFTMLWQLPIAYTNSEPMISEDNEFPLIQDIIENNESFSEDESSDDSNIRIAFYNSSHNVAFNEGGITTENKDKIPFSYVRNISEQVKLSDKRFRLLDSYSGRYVNPLSLNFLNSEIYSKGPKVDRSKIYKIKFLNNFRKLDAKKIYIIGNRKFYCLKLEKNITMNGFNEITEGEFYAEKD